ncbi:MAG TPA: thymidine phosphorylase [Chloroflexia bacterium]|nr:thymidine phosphorylase [Chloroflexia bacterium]
MRAVDLIVAKRNGEAHTREELSWLIGGLLDESIPDYQMAAWLMAVCWRGMTPQETADLTAVMVDSGRRLDLRAAAPFVADKHSTGGVGDKTTLVVAPLVAAAGVPVGKMSGRGLGFSGGTIDKLESIPGFRVQLSDAEFIEGVRQVGLVVAAQTSDLAPADGRLYSLRDVTGTVESLPLIASSIMSKKLAAGANAIVLDVKVGKGAFMKTEAAARALAEAMVSIGQAAGLQVRAVLSSMDQPLGRAIGNALEVREAIDTLRGAGPPDLRDLALDLGGQLLAMAGKAADGAAARPILLDALQSGAALARLRAFVANQGGDPTYVDDPDKLPIAPRVTPISAPAAGYVASIDAEELGLAAVSLGAGRQAKGDAIDPAVGFWLHHKIGDRVAAGDALISIHARSPEHAASVAERVAAAVILSPEPVAVPPLVLGMY